MMLRTEAAAMSADFDEIHHTMLMLNTSVMTNSCTSVAASPPLALANIITITVEHECGLAIDDDLFPGRGRHRRTPCPARRRA